MSGDLPNQILPPVEVAGSARLNRRVAQPDGLARGDEEVSEILTQSRVSVCTGDIQNGRSRLNRCADNYLHRRPDSREVSYHRASCMLINPVK